MNYIFDYFFALYCFLFQKYQISINLISFVSYSFYFLCSLLFISFLLYNIVLVLPYINLHPPWVYTCSPSWTPLPPPTHTIPLGHPSAPAPSFLYPASNLDWRLYYTEWSKPERKTPIQYTNAYIWNLERW